MAGYSARQSTYTTGDTISAADSNDEFDTLLTAFGTSGHVHDGSAGNGGNVTALRGHALTFGLGTAGADVVITFDGDDNDGVFSWMEDEDYFKFSDDLMIVDNESLIFGSDSNILIQYDETTTDSLRISAAEGAGLAITLAADEGDDAGDEWKVNIADGGVMTWGNDKNSAGTYVTHVTFTPHATVASSTVAFAGGVTVAGDLTISGDDLTMGTNTSGAILVADGTNYNPAVVSGDIAIATNGVASIGSGVIVDADVSASAAIAFSKLANLTTARALVSDGSGDVSVSSVTSTELGYLDITTLGTSEASKAVTVDSNGDLLVPDSDKYKFGASSDMQVYHDGTNSYITNATGALKIATESSGIAVTIGHGTSEVTVADNLTVTGDLTVNGDTTTVNTATLSVEDPLIIMASGNNSADSVDIGFYGLYDTSGSQDLYAGLFRDASDSGKFKLFKDLQAAPTTTVNTGGTGYAVGTLVADTEGTHNGNVVVANDGDVGSTGATDAMQISSAGIVTFKDDILIKDGGTIGVASSAAAITIASTGIVSFVDDITIKDGGTIGTATTPGAMTVASGGALTFSAVPLFPNDTIETADIQADAITGAKIADDALDSEHYTDGSIDLAHIAAAAKTECIAIACSDETTALATAAAQATFHMPYAFTLTNVKAGLTTAPVGSVFTVDINEAGSTILSTKLTIDAAEKTSGTAATAAVISDTSLADNALMTVDIDGVGSSIAGAGLKVYLIGYQT